MCTTQYYLYNSLIVVIISCALIQSLLMMAYATNHVPNNVDYSPKCVHYFLVV